MSLEQSFNLLSANLGHHLYNKEKGNYSVDIFKISNTTRNNTITQLCCHINLWPISQIQGWSKRKNIYELKILLKFLMVLNTMQERVECRLKTIEKNLTSLFTTLLREVFCCKEEGVENIHSMQFDSRQT